MENRGKNIFFYTYLIQTNYYPEYYFHYSSLSTAVWYHFIWCDISLRGRWFPINLFYRFFLYNSLFAHPLVETFTTLFQPYRRLTIVPYDCLLALIVCQILPAMTELLPTKARIFIVETQKLQSKYFCWQALKYTYYQQAINQNASMPN